MANKKIFLVDDDKLFTAMLSDHLEEKGGYDVSVHHTGEACLAHLSENPDFIILDYYLDSDDASAQNGLEILKQIRKANSEAKVIMLSSQEHYGVAAQTIAKGALYYVIKDNLSFDEIDNVLDGM